MYEIIEAANLDVTKQKFKWLHCFIFRLDHFDNEHNLPLLIARQRYMNVMYLFIPSNFLHGLTITSLQIKKYFICC